MQPICSACSWCYLHVHAAGPCPVQPAGAGSSASVPAGLDVYENEASIFFSDFSQQDRASKVKARDSMLSTLQGFPNVLITPHSAFLTTEALRSIADTTMNSLHEIAEGKPLTHQLHA